MITDKRSAEKFDYRAPAELFSSKNIRIQSRVVKYMRFQHAAEAIRFVIEKLPADVVLAAYLEVDEKRYDCRGIRTLYDRPEYPLPRLVEAA
ncbi:MAG: hypothetical protein ACTHJS_13160 [Xanthobacteraceae bacterium]